MNKYILVFNSDTCQVAFPGLHKEICGDDAIAHKFHPSTWTLNPTGLKVYELTLEQIELCVEKSYKFHQEALIKRKLADADFRFR